MENYYHTIQFHASTYEEKSWQKYLSLFIKNNENIIDELKPFLGVVPDDILIPVGIIVGKSASIWLTKELEEIPGYTPIDLLKTKDGLKALRAIIMRLPC